MKRSTHDPMKGQELLSKLGGKDNSKPQAKIPRGKNRVLILEQIAQKWADHGLYQNPSRAMAALLGASE
jgi:hypothetical protein